MLCRSPRHRYQRGSILLGYRRFIRRYVAPEITLYRILAAQEPRVARHFTIVTGPLPFHSFNHIFQHPLQPGGLLIFKSSLPHVHFMATFIFAVIQFRFILLTLLPVSLPLPIFLFSRRHLRARGDSVTRDALSSRHGIYLL